MTPSSTIRITVDGQVAETIGMAATRLHRDPGALTTALRRAGVTPAARLDARTPLYLADDIDIMIKSSRHAPAK